MSNAFDDNKLDQFLRQSANKPPAAPPQEEMQIMQRIDELAGETRKAKAGIWPRVLAIAAMLALIIYVGKQNPAPVDQPSIDTILSESYDTVYDTGAVDMEEADNGEVDWIALARIVDEVS